MATAVKAHEPSDTCRFIAKEGEGYEWLKNEGTSELAAALSETPDTTVILNLGVNDITEADAYISIINSSSLLSRHRFPSDVGKSGQR